MSRSECGAADQATDRRRRPRGGRLEDGRFVRVQQPGSPGARDGQPDPRGRRRPGLSTRIPVARMLTQRQTLTIGVLTPQALSVIFSNPFFGAFSEGVARASPRNSGTGSTSSRRCTAAWPARWIARRSTASSPSACPMTTPRSNRSDGRACRSCWWTPTALPEHGSVEIDDAGGARAAADHLIALGHRNVLVVGRRAAGARPSGWTRTASWAAACAPTGRRSGPSASPCPTSA